MMSQICTSTGLNLRRLSDTRSAGIYTFGYDLQSDCVITPIRICTNKCRIIWKNIIAHDDVLFTSFRQQQKPIIDVLMLWIYFFKDESEKKSSLCTALSNTEYSASDIYRGRPKHWTILFSICMLCYTQPHYKLKYSKRRRWHLRVNAKDSFFQNPIL